MLLLLMQLSSRRTNQGLDGDSPVGLVVERHGVLMRELVLGGLPFRHRRTG